jgi:hypothetical protein
MLVTVVKKSASDQQKNDSRVGNPRGRGESDTDTDTESERASDLHQKLSVWSRVTTCYVRTLWRRLRSLTLRSYSPADALPLPCLRSGSQKLIFSIICRSLLAHPQINALRTQCTLNAEAQYHLVSSYPPFYVLTSLSPLVIWCPSPCSQVPARSPIPCARSPPKTCWRASQVLQVAHIVHGPLALRMMGPGVAVVACSAYDQVRDGHSHDHNGS